MMDAGERRYRQPGWLPELGTILTAWYGGKRIVAVVVQTTQGRRIRLPDGSLRGSLTAAADFYTHDSGWRFWDWPGKEEFAPP